MDENTKAEIKKGFLKNYKTFLQSCPPENTPHGLRMRLSFMSQASKALLDNESACSLLEENCNKYAEVVNKEYEMHDACIKEAFGNRKFEPQLNLQKWNIAKMIKPLKCSNEPFCIANKDIKDEDAKEYFSAFHSRPTPKEPQPDLSKRVKTVSKSFAPRSCNPAAGRVKLTRTNSESASIAFRTAREEYDRQAAARNDSLESAREELDIQNVKKYGDRKKRLGGRRAVSGKFVSPILSNGDMEVDNPQIEGNQEIDDRLKNIEPKMVELIRSEIMDSGPSLSWDDIAGLEFAKTAIQEAVVWPLLRPDIFTGLRRPPKGILLFGPPGTGKTLIGKCVASHSKSTFFSISASSLTSKWIGDGEKMVRALFTVARCHQPAVIFIDEIDSLLSQRSDTEHESSRRIKTEFLVQLDGATTDSDERLLIVGATNRPQELDEAARRRFVKRLYIPLPEMEGRVQLIQQLMKSEKNLLSQDDIVRIASLTEGYSGADIRILCCEASMGPIRSLDIRLIENIDTEQVRSICFEDFQKALVHIKASVAQKDLVHCIEWNKIYGCGV